MYTIRTMPQETFDKWMKLLEYPLPGTHQLRKKYIDTAGNYCALTAYGLANSHTKNYNVAVTKVVTELGFRLQTYVVTLNDVNHLSFIEIAGILRYNRTNAQRKYAKRIAVQDDVLVY